MVDSDVIHVCPMLPVALGSRVPRVALRSQSLIGTAVALIITRGPDCRWDRGGLPLVWQALAASAEDC